MPLFDFGYIELSKGHRLSVLFEEAIINLGKNMQNLIAIDFKTQLEQDSTAQILDVRTSEECAAGMIQGALNCDIFDPDFLSKAQSQLQKSSRVYVYCRSGARSASASAMLESAGYTVVNLIGGYTAWAVKGY